MRYAHGHHAGTPEHRDQVARMGRTYGAANAAKRDPTDQRGEKNPYWKGDAAGRQGMHLWMRRRWTKCGICENCEKRGHTEWANLSGEYHRERTDWAELCGRCHRVLDDNFGGGANRLTHLVGRRTTGLIPAWCAATLEIAA